MMANQEVISVSLFPASELLSQIVLEIGEVIHAAETVLIQRDNFRKFSTFLEKITFILKQLSTTNFCNSSIKNALKILNREIMIAKQLAFDCSNRNKVYLLTNCRKIVRCLDSSTKEMGRALSLISLASLNVSLNIKQEIIKLHMNMLAAEYCVAVIEEEVMEKIEVGIQERNIDRSYANNLLNRIAEAIGISIEQSALKREFEGFKNEIKEAKVRKDMAEVLQMEQIIAMLEKADAITSHEEKEMRYMDKINSLGRKPLEPLNSFYCPITLEVLVDPVETSSGKTFERSAIEKWFAEGNTLCPLTMIPVDTSVLRPNKTLRQSIEEWKDRNIMITISSMKSIFQLNEEQEVLDSLIKLKDLCIARELHREWIVMEDYITILIGLLGTKNREIRKHALAILWILAKDSWENKERIFSINNAIESMVRSLARQIEESKLALQLLLELSRSNAIRDSIGNAQGCILLLVTMSSNDDTEASKDAHELLSNLASLDHNVVKMAQANYFRPLLHCLASGPENVKISMAEALSEIELNDHSKLSLFKDGVLGPLLQLLSDGDIEKKTVAVKALQTLSTVPQNGLQIIREGAADPLFELLYRHSLSLPTLREHVAATIMNLAISTTTIVQDADQLQVSLPESEEDVFKLFSLISLTGPNMQRSILCTFHAMCQSLSGLHIRTKLRQISAVQVLVQLCELENPTIRGNAIKLLCCLTKDGDDSTFLEHVGQRCIETLLRIISSSDNDEEVDAALGVISNLPKEPQMTQWLLDAGALEIIFARLTDRNCNTPIEEQTLENAIKALCRFTVSTNLEWQKKVVEAGIFPVVVKLLVYGTPSTKQYAAIVLKQLSESSTSLSQPVKRHGIFWCCLASPEIGCPAHLGICTEESSFCLLEANAIESLVKLLGDPDHGACEASFDALLTLIDGERLQSGSKVLAEANAVHPIIRLLSSPSVKLQEKALNALEKIFRLDEFKQRYGTLAQMALVDITQRGSRDMKSLAAKILSYLNVLHEQSSYF